MTTTNTPLAERKAPSLVATAAVNAENPVLTRLHSRAQSQRLRRRQSIATTIPDTTYIVRSGFVTAEHASMPCGPMMVELLYPGDIIAPCLQPLRPAVTYTTMTPTELLRIGTSTLRTEMAHDPALSDFILQRLNLQRARMQLHISMLGGLSSVERVAALLLQAAYHLGTANGGSVSLDMPLTRAEVAEYLALNADTLSRIMARLVRENVLARTSRAQFTIRNMDALKALCPLSDDIAALHANDQ